MILFRDPIERLHRRILESLDHHTRPLHPRSPAFSRWRSTGQHNIVNIILSTSSEQPDISFVIIIIIIRQTGEALSIIMSLQSTQHCRCWIMIKNILPDLSDWRSVIMPLHNTVDGSLLDDRSPTPSHHIYDPHGENMKRMIFWQMELWKPKIFWWYYLEVALPLLGIMSTKEVAINYLNGTNYMVSMV